jgi:hypothetical protein
VRFKWSRRESNSYLKFRKLLFYPLNYGTFLISDVRFRIYPFLTFRFKICANVQIIDELVKNICVSCKSICTSAYWMFAHQHICTLKHICTLTHYRTIVKIIIRRNKCQFTFSILCHQDHPLRKNAFYFAWLQIYQDAHLFADYSFRLVILCNA